MKTVEIRITRWLAEYPDLIPGHKYRLNAAVVDRLKMLGAIDDETHVLIKRPRKPDHEHDRMVE